MRLQKSETVPLPLFPEQDDEYWFLASTKNSRKMAKNATRFKMAMHLNRSGKNIRYENFRISYKMLLKNNKYIYILTNLSVPRIEIFLWRWDSKLKFRANKVQKKKGKKGKNNSTDSVECRSLRSYPIPLAALHSPAIRIHLLSTISRFPPRNSS